MPLSLGRTWALCPTSPTISSSPTQSTFNTHPFHVVPSFFLLGIASSIGIGGVSSTSSINEFVHSIPTEKMNVVWSPTKGQQEIWTSLDFLWVENSQEKADSRKTQSFLRRKYHRVRRQMQLEQLRASMQAPPPAAWLPAFKSTVDTSSDNKSNDRRTLAMRIMPVHQMGSQIHHPPQTRVDDVLPALSRRSKQSMDFYFDYCQ